MKHSEIKQQLTAVYTDCCVAHSLPDLTASDDELDKLIKELIQSIFKDRSIATAPQGLLDLFAEELLKAVIQGYGKSLEDVDFDTPDRIMLEALQQDTFTFSSAKNEAMNKAMFRELVDETGTLRSFNDFRKAAYDIADTHVNTWLKAEYNLAVTSAQAASKWVDIEKNSDTLPILVFDAVMDDNTTEICKNFNGIRLPFDHPFWDMYYIPNHYGERSLIKQDDDNSDLTDISTIKYPEKIPAMFKVNLPKLKMVFPPGHPYYNG